MAKSGNQKGKLLYLAEIFHRETDEAHGLTLAELTERLAAYGVQAERKTLYADMEELRRCGLDIDSWKEGREYRYRLASREFELPELKLLVDAVQASRFITENKSRSLIKKLESLVSVHDARQLQRQVLIAGRVKTMNESIYYNIDKLHTAIGEGKQIRFQYFQWTVEKKEALRRDGGWYCVSPWHLRWDDENYYLIAYDAEADRVKHYRVDKMADIMQNLRDNPPKDFAGDKVVKVVDYKKPEETGLPAANVLIYTLESGATVVVRPSGTEPKIKTYFTTKGKDLAEAEAQKEKLAEACKPLLA